jgi:hypothetical protein
MNKLTKYVIAGAFILNPLSGLKAQTNSEVTLKPKYSTEFWESKKGFKYTKGDTTYRIKNSEEILTIDNQKMRIKITERNHYGNVEEVSVENLDKKVSIVMSKEKGGLKYHFEKIEGKEAKTERIQLSCEQEKRIYETYLENDKLFRKFKKENELEKNLKKNP